VRLDASEPAIPIAPIAIIAAEWSSDRRDFYDNNTARGAWAYR
jgi:hypothetical protein